MHRPLFSEKYCKLPDLIKLWKKLFFPQTYWFSFMLSAGFLSCLRVDAGLATQVANRSPWILLIAFVIGICLWFATAMMIRRKVSNFVTAVKRASFFCCVEYFRSFCVILFVYMGFIGIAMLLSNDLNHAKSQFEIAYSNLGTLGDDCLGHAWTSLSLGDISLNIQLLFAAAFIGFGTGFCTLMKKYFGQV